MSGWNVEFNSHVEESVYNAVQSGKHLKGFSIAEQKLNDLKSLLDKIRFDCDWWREKCESEADHYAYMQKQLRENPNDFSEEHAREVSSKSPQVFYEYSAKLKEGANKLRDAISYINEILNNLERARDDAEEDGKKVSDKIMHAIELMEEYLRVSF